MVTILDIAIARGATKNEDGSIGADAFFNLSFPFFAGCQNCEASLGPAQSFPSKTGFIRCEHCIGDIGFTTVEEFDKWEEKETSEI